MRTRSRRRDLENKDLAAPTNSSPPKPMQWTGYPSWFIYERTSTEEEESAAAEACSNYEEEDLGADDEHYCPSATSGDYGPSCPWNAPGMSIKDFI